MAIRAGGVKLKKSSTLDEIVEVIGLPATLFLSRHFGSRALKIPIHATATSPLAIAIGGPAANLLCDQYRGEYLNVPAESTVLLQYAEALEKGRAELLAYRNQLIRGEVAAGGKILRVALKYSLSRKMIRKIIAPRGNGPTPSRKSVSDSLQGYGNTAPLRT